MQISLDAFFLIFKNNSSLLKKLISIVLLECLFCSELARKHVEQNKVNRNKDMKMKNWPKDSRILSKRGHQDDEKNVVQLIMRWRNSNDTNYSLCIINLREFSKSFLQQI